MGEFLLKYIDSTGQARYRPVDELNDGFRLKFIKLGGTFEFDESNIVTVSGVNSLTDTITELSGAIDIRDQEVTDIIEATSGVLDSKIDSVSSTSEFNDNALLALQLAGDAILDLKIDSVSGTSEFNDNALLDLINGVSGKSDDEDAILLDLINGVSGKSDDEDAILLDLINGTSGSSDDNDDLLQAQIDAITSDTAEEECILSVSGERIFAVSGFTFDGDNAVKDIFVFRNMGHLKQGRDYDKISTFEIELRYDTEPGDIIAIREERTGGVGNTEWRTRVEISDVLSTIDHDEIIMAHAADSDVYLPPNPVVSDRVRVGDASAAGASVDKINVLGNGNDINGVSSFDSFDDGQMKVFIFVGSGLDWRAFGA